jgi:hypothetical protein
VAVGLVVSIDFFNVMYPEKEAFLDQTFTAPRDATANEPAPTSSPATSNATGEPSRAISLLISPANAVLAAMMVALMFLM